MSSFTDWESSDTFASTGNLAYSSSKPLFVDAAASNYALATGSQAIDKGENDYAVDVDGKTLKRDVAGKTRIVGNSVDVGAYEYQGAVKTPLTAVTITGADLNVGTTLTATVSPTGATASYQWRRVSTTGTETVIAGATGKTYALTSSDVGYYVKVVATGTGNYSGTVSTKTVALVEEKTLELTDVIITGVDLYVGTTLTARVSPTGATASYQWYRVAENDATTKINGATASVYVLSNADVGYRVKVVAIGSDDYAGIVSAQTIGLVERKTSELTDVTITGSDLYVGTTLTASVSPTGATASYQWFRISASGDETEITDATEATYVLTTSDVGYYVEVVATGTGDYSGTVSAKTTAVVAKKTAKLTAVTLASPNLYVGTTLTASVSPAGATASYQWCRVTATGSGTVISGATGKTYVLTTSDVGYYIKVVATGSGAYTGSVSAKTTGVVATKSTALTDVTLTVPDLYVGTTLTASVSPADATASYRWRRVSSTGVETTIAGATGKTYVLTSSDVGYYVKAVATGTGSYSGTVSAQTTGVVEAKSTALTAVTLTGANFGVGTTLTASVSPTGATASYQWRRVSSTGVETTIAGANGNAYVLTTSDVGYYVEVVAIGTGDYSGTVSARTTGVVVSKTITLTAVTLTSDNLYVGTTLTANVFPKGATATYRWYRVSTDGTGKLISGENSSTYVFAPEDVGRYVRVVATGTGNYSGNAVAKTSGVVVAKPDDPTEIDSVSIDCANFYVGTTLTASVSPADATASYRWIRVSPKGATSEIEGATSATYVPTTDDLGYYVRVEVVGTGDFTGTVFATTSQPIVARPTTKLTKVGTSTGAPKVGYEITTRLYVGSTVKSGATATYQWYRVDGDGVWESIDGATESSYTPVAADADFYIAVEATGTGDYSGTVSAKHSAATAFVKVAKVSTSTTQPTVGVEITARVSSPTNAKASFQWYRVDDSNKAKPINGATSATYTPTVDDVGTRLRVKATGTDGCIGYATVTHSAKTISAQPKEKLTRVGTSTSQPQVGVKITTTLFVGKTAKQDATANYQWYRVDAKTGAATKIAGATSSSYTPTAADVGFKIRVTAVGTGSYAGTVTTTHSRPTIAGQTTEKLSRIGTSTSQPTVGVEITTTLYVGTAKRSDATATYQWYRVDAKTGKATAISGATSSSYTPTVDDLGFKIRVTAVGTGSYTGTVTTTHSRPTIAAASIAVLDVAVFDAAFASLDDWDDAFVEF